MKDQNKFDNLLPFLLLLICSIPLFFMNVHERHSWGGDDYALYIKEADNISKGIPFYKTGFVFYDRNICYSPPQYPPGFPLLLAPIIKYWGMSIKAMCYYNTAIIVALMLVVFAWLRKQIDIISALCITMIIGYSWSIIDIKGSILSDLPCLLFTMLYLLYRRSDSFPLWRILLLIIFATIAIMIRTQSVLLLFAEIGLVAIKTIETLKEKKYEIKKLANPSAYVILGVLFCTYIVNRFIFPSPTSTSGFYVNYLKIAAGKGIPTLFRDNVNFLLETITHFFYYETDNGFRTALVSIMQSAGLCLTIIGFYISISKKLDLEDILFILLVLMMLSYPIHDNRYFLPAIVITYYYSFLTLAKTVPVISNVSTRKLKIITTCIILFTGLKYLKSTLFAPYGFVPAANDYKAIAYIKEHVNDTDIILFSRPRYLTLYTGKRSLVQAWLLPMKENHKIFDSLKVKYALSVKGLINEFNDQYFAEEQHPIDSTIIAEGYTLYTLR